MKRKLGKSGFDKGEMAVEKYIEAGDKLSDEQLYEEAIEQYDLALKENPKAFKALIAKSIALQRNKQLDEALKVVCKAFDVAKQRGSRESIGLAYFRLFTIFHKKGDYQTAIKYLNSAKDLGHDPKAIDLWAFQVKRKVEKTDLKDFDYEARETSKPEGFEEEEPEEIPQEPKNPKEPKIAEIIEEEPPKPTITEPLPTPFEQKSPNFKIDWFQSLDKITVTLFVKNIPKDDSLKIKYRKQSVSIEFPTASSSEFQYDIGPLFGDIKPEESTHQVFSTKLELSLAKAVESKWKELTRRSDEEPAQEQKTTEPIPKSVLTYPNSARNAKDWSKLTLDDDEDESEKKDENSFFAELYKNADDDTKRAMMKSYVESNGTALSTNWGEVSKKTVETSPPDGLEAKKW